MTKSECFRQDRPVAVSSIESAYFWRLPDRMEAPRKVGGRIKDDRFLCKKNGFLKTEAGTNQANKSSIAHAIASMCALPIALMMLIAVVGVAIFTTFSFFGMCLL